MFFVYTAYHWYLNRHLDERDLESRVSMVARAGFDCIYVHADSTCELPFLSASWWKIIDVIIENCRKYNVKYGIVLPAFSGKSSAENAVQYLEVEEFELRANERFCGALKNSGFLVGCYALYDKSTLVNITDECGKIHPTVNAADFTPEKDCRVIAVTAVRKYPYRINLLDEKAVKDSFVKILEAYYSKYQEYFGNVINSCFVETPEIGSGYLWSDDFNERFNEMWQSSLADELPYLFLETDENSLRVRNRYRLVQKDLLCCNYLSQIGLWCKNHSIEFAGTLPQGDAFPDKLRCYRHFDTPCVREDTAIELKTVSSAAKLFGKTQCAGVLQYTPSLRELRSRTDWQMAMGITRFDLSIPFDHTEWAVLPQFIGEIKEKCRRFLSSCSVCRSAVLYPTNGSFVEKLLISGYDFDFVDEITLVEMTAETLSQKYDCFIVPEKKFTTRQAEETLECFTGRLLCFDGEINSLSGAEDIVSRKFDDGTLFLYNHSENLFKGFYNGTDITLYPRCGELLENAAAVFPNIRTTSEITGNWQVKIKENHITLISESMFKLYCHGKIKELFAVIDANSDGAKINGCEMRSLPQECNGGQIVYDITRFLKSGSRFEENILSFNTLSGVPCLYGTFTVNFKYAPEEKLYLTADDLVFDAPLGDIGSLGLGTYSGAIHYSKQFVWRGGNLLVDAGRVEDACTIDIDGENKAVIIAPPYTANAGFVSPGKHLLEITVYNEPANRNSLCGTAAGLYGPVKLLEYE